MFCDYSLKLHLNVYNIPLDNLIKKYFKTKTILEIVLILLMALFCKSVADILKW